LITTHKWHTEIKLVIKGEIFNTIALIDSGADVNCIQEGLIPTQYYEKTLEKVTSPNGFKMNIQYKLSNAKICKGKICYNTSFILIKNMNAYMILGTLFLTLLYPFQVTEKGLIKNTMGKEICFKFIKPPRIRELNLLKESSISHIEGKRKQINLLNKEIRFKRAEEQLKNHYIQTIIKEYEEKIEKEIYETNPTTFWHRKKYIVALPYIDNFDEKQIPTKARPIQMNQQYLEYCRKEIQEYLDKGLIRPSKSPWSCSRFYVMKASEIERGATRLVINYKPLNKVFKWIRYPLPNKIDLIKRICDATIFSKFDMKSGYHKISIKEEHHYIKLLL